MGIRVLFVISVPSAFSAAEASRNSHTGFVEGVSTTERIDVAGAVGYLRIRAARVLTRRATVAVRRGDLTRGAACRDRFLSADFVVVSDAALNVDRAQATEDVGVLTTGPFLRLAAAAFAGRTSATALTERLLHAQRIEFDLAAERIEVTHALAHFWVRTRGKRARGAAVTELCLEGFSVRRVRGLPIERIRDQHVLLTVRDRNELFLIVDAIADVDEIAFVVYEHAIDVAEGMLEVEHHVEGFALRNRWIEEVVVLVA
jgi:hypothetical protein